LRQAGEWPRPGGHHEDPDAARQRFGPQCGGVGPGPRSRHRMAQSRQFVASPDWGRSAGFRQLTPDVVQCGPNGAYGVEPSVQQATADIGTIMDIVVLSVLLFGRSFFVRPEPGV
jgi:hypothetical protein